MPRFLNGDRVRYMRSAYQDKEGYIAGIKKMQSEETGRPIYHIIWVGEGEVFSYGIHERNLKLISRKPQPDWEV